MDNLIYVVVKIKVNHIVEVLILMEHVVVPNTVVQVIFIVLLIVPMDLVQKKPVVPVKFPI